MPQIVHPLTRDGINGYRVGTKKTGALHISKKELPKLRTPVNMRNSLADSAAQTAIELLSPNFVDRNKWRAAQGGEPFWVRILDEDFLAEVDSGEKGFVKGDYLVVLLRTQACSTVDGLVVERDVIRVIDHKHRVKQLAL